jgi:hypothetical protein
MFARRKQNRNGTTSAHVIDKSHKGYRVVKSFGVGHSEVEICRLEEKARQYILERQGLANGLFEEKLITFLLPQGGLIPCGFFIPVTNTEPSAPRSKRRAGGC